MLQALLDELRQVRQEIRGLTLIGQRAQILLHRVQLQDEVTKKAGQRYEQASGRLRDTERGHAEVAARLKAVKEKLTASTNPSDRAAAEDLVRELEGRVEALSRDEAAFRAEESAARSDFRTEEAKRGELQQRLDRLDQQLESYSAANTKR